MPERPVLSSTQLAYVLSLIWRSLFQPLPSSQTHTRTWLVCFAEYVGASLNHRRMEAAVIIRTVQYTIPFSPAWKIQPVNQVACLVHVWIAPIISCNNRPKKTNSPIVSIQCSKKHWKAIHIFEPPESVQSMLVNLSCCAIIMPVR